MKKLKTSIIGVRYYGKNPTPKVLKLAKKYDLALDIGCGTGRNLIFPISVGIDLDPEILRGSNNIVVIADGQHLPFRDKSFDLAMHCYTLEFMKDQVEAIKERERVGRSTFHLPAPSKRAWKIWSFMYICAIKTQNGRWAEIYKDKNTDRIDFSMGGLIYSTTNLSKLCILICYNKEPVAGKYNGDIVEEFMLTNDEFSLIRRFDDGTKTFDEFISSIPFLEKKFIAMTLSSLEL